MTSALASLLRSFAEGGLPEVAEIRAALAEDADAAGALVDLAQRVRTLRQRSAELRSVVASTKDLLTISDPDRLLQRIVDRAHELISVDIAYLSVYEPSRDELYVRAASGTISQRFLGMVVPAGVGLASLAVRTRQPQWVDDYAGLKSVPHDPQIDAIVKEEQLRSLLGAPLVVGDHVLGVLFAASREARAFRPDEISLLLAFAGHAALVLHLTRLLQQAQEAMIEAATRRDEAEWAAALHGELTRLVVYGHGADAVVSALAGALGRRVGLTDGDGALISVRGGDGEPLGTGESLAFDREWLSRALRDVDDTGRSVMVSHRSVELLAPVIATAGPPSALIVERSDRALTAVERRTIERSALTAALLTLRQDALVEAQERVRGELAAELLEPGDVRRAALERAMARGYPVAGPWLVIAVPVDTPENRQAVLARLRMRIDWLVASSGESVVVLAPRIGAADAQAVRDAANCPIAVFRESSGLQGATLEASTVVQVARLVVGLDGATGIVDAATFAPYASLFEGDGARARAFVDGVLAPVLAWDARHGTQLFDTLEVLFDSQWTVARAARSAHLHVNTLKQRVHRLHALLGEGLRRPEARFRVELAVRIESARRSVGPMCQTDI